MLIFGHKWIESPVLTKITTFEEIKLTPPNSVIILDMPSDSSKHLHQHCKENSVPFAFIISSLTDAVIASNLGASYAICSDRNKAIKLQKLANDYLFDMKMLFEISSYDEIEALAELGVDGVILKN